jgi:hypothetical protein
VSAPSGAPPYAKPVVDAVVVGRTSAAAATAHASTSLRRPERMRRRTTVRERKSGVVPDLGVVRAGL